MNKGYAHQSRITEHNQRQRDSPALQPLLPTLSPQEGSAGPGIPWETSPVLYTLKLHECPRESPAMLPPRPQVCFFGLHFKPVFAGSFVCLPCLRGCRGSCPRGVQGETHGAQPANAALSGWAAPTPHPILFQTLARPGMAEPRGTETRQPRPGAALDDGQHPSPQSFTKQTLGFMITARAVSARHFCHLPFSFLTLGRAVKCLLLVMSALNPFSRALMDPEENRDVSLASERRTKRK